MSPTVSLYLQSLKSWQLWSWPWISPSPQVNFLHRSKSLENMLLVHHQGRRKGTVNTSTLFKIWQTPNSNCDLKNNWTTNYQWKAKWTKLEGAHHDGCFGSLLSPWGKPWKPETPIVLRVSSSQWRGCPRFSPHISTSWWLEKCSECSTQVDHTVDLPLWLSALSSKVFLDMWKNCCVSKLLLSESTTSWWWLE